MPKTCINTVYRLYTHLRFQDTYYNWELSFLVNGVPKYITLQSQDPFWKRISLSYQGSTVDKKINSEINLILVHFNLTRCLNYFKTTIHFPLSSDCQGNIFILSEKETFTQMCNIVRRQNNQCSKCNMVHLSSIKLRPHSLWDCLKYCILCQAERWELYIMTTISTPVHIKHLTIEFFKMFFSV